MTIDKMFATPHISLACKRLLDATRFDISNAITRRKDGMALARKNRLSAMTTNGDRSALTSEKMHRILFDAITEHKILPGTKLREEDLAEAFGVSRTKIRELLQRLSYLGIVELHPHRSAFVAKPSEEESRRVFQARRILEAGSIPEIIQNLTDKDVVRLEALIDKELDAVRNKDRSAAIRYSGEFHVQLCETIGNESLTEILRGLVSRTSLILAVFPSPSLTTCDSGSHHHLLNEIREGNVENAVQALKDDLFEAERSLIFTKDKKTSVNLNALVEEFLTQDS